MNIYSKIQVLLLLLIGMSGGLSAQQQYSSIREQGSMSITGTSNLHDWEMALEEFHCTLTLEGGNPSLLIQSVSFTGTSKSLKSHSKIMDHKTYEAIDAGRYPQIRFAATSSPNIPVTSRSFAGTITGDLFLAGRTRSVSVPFSGNIVSDDEIRISGSKELTMSDYDIDPPTAVMGTLKTGDEVTISFSLVLKKELLISKLNNH